MPSVDSSTEVAGDGAGLPISEEVVESRGVARGAPSGRGLQ